MARAQPLDALIRQYLNAFLAAHRDITQEAFAKRIGRNQGWFHKYLNGVGHASIDDLIRIAHALFNTTIPFLTKKEQHLLQTWHQLLPVEQKHVLQLVEALAARRRPSAQSNEREAHTARRVKNKVPETRARGSE